MIRIIELVSCSSVAVVAGGVVGVVVPETCFKVITGGGGGTSENSSTSVSSLSDAALTLERRCNSTEPLFVIVS